MKAQARLEHWLVAVESQQDIACMYEIQTPPAPVSKNRRPIHVALVIDRSGSMSGRKLEFTKKCAEFLATRLGPKDRMSLVTFDDDVQLMSSMIATDAKGRKALINAIKKVHSGGSTNLAGGWLKGVETFDDQPDAAEAVKVVILLTDGMANVGITEPGDLINMSRGVRESKGVITTTIGFGDGFNEDLLAAMAGAGHGNTYFAETPDAAPGIFATEFGDLVRVVAENLSIEIQPSPNVRLLSILNEFPTVPVAKGVQVQIGQAYGDETQRVVFQLNVPALKTLGLTKIADVVFRYTTVGDAIEMHQSTTPLTVNAVSADEAAKGSPDPAVTEEVVILLSAKAQESARQMADRGDYASAGQILKEAAENLRRIAPTSERADQLLQEADLLDVRSTRLSSAEYGSLDRKQMTYDTRRLRQGRDRYRH